MTIILFYKFDSYYDTSGPKLLNNSVYIKNDGELQKNWEKIVIAHFWQIWFLPALFFFRNVLFCCL